MRNRVAIITTIALLHGCATLQPNQVALTVRSNPPGAMIYEEGGLWGQAPQTRIYTSSTNGATITTRKITAVWPSEAKKTTYYNLPTGQGEKVGVIERPMDAPGLDRDLAYLNQARQTEATESQAAAARAQAEAAEAQAKAARDQSFNQMLNSRIGPRSCRDVGMGVISCN